jgi:hypothetical protein
METTPGRLYPGPHDPVHIPRLLNRHSATSLAFLFVIDGALEKESDPSIYGCLGASEIQLNVCYS